MGQWETGLVRVEGGETGRSGGSLVSLKSTSTYVLPVAVQSGMRVMQTAVFCDVTPCRLVEVYLQIFQKNLMPAPLGGFLSTLFSSKLKMEAIGSWRQCTEWNRSVRPSIFMTFRGFTAMNMKMSSTVWHCIAWLNLQTFRTNILPPYSG